MTSKLMEYKQFLYYYVQNYDFCYYEIFRWPQMKPKEEKL